MSTSKTITLNENINFVFSPISAKENVIPKNKQLIEICEQNINKVDTLSPTENRNFLEPRKPSSIRKPLKRIRSPTLDNDCSPSKLFIFLNI